ncbi:DUF4944 domain-containing protein [Fictibacillus gelatini]|uniref:DUF4944 domain-containing protein n=1 Tax=Fictibacillus gelatini TaxID=225985 RepID=UPI003898E3E6
MAKDKESDHVSYFGKAYWLGDKKAVDKTDITFLQFRVNGKYHTGDKQERTSKKEMRISFPDNTGFVEMEPYKTINNKKLVVYLHWKQDNQIHKTQIHLKKITGKE